MRLLSMIREAKVCDTLNLQLKCFLLEKKKKEMSEIHLPMSDLLIVSSWMFVSRVLNQMQ